MPSYHTGPVLLRAIHAVLQQPELKELVIVDNGNSDYIRGKLEELQKKHEHLHIIRDQGNIGFARACNVGVRETTSDYLLFLNPDCILPEKALRKALDAMQCHPQAWLAGCRLVNTDGTEKPGNRRNLLNFTNLISEWLHLYRWFRLPRLELYDISPPAGISTVPAISSAFMLIRRDRYQELGGMDKHYFLYIEDMDLCQRVEQGGGDIIFINSLEVLHYGRTSDVSPVIREMHIGRSLVHYFTKHFKGAYVPGGLLALSLLIYARVGLMAVYYSLRQLVPHIRHPLCLPPNRMRYVEFLKTYTEFEATEEDKAKDSRFFIHNRAPILITDGESQVGLYLLRRLLGAQAQVIALYSDSHPDIYHPKLTWLKAQFGKRGLDFPPETKIKTVICTSPLQNLPPYLEKLKSYGMQRLIALVPLSYLANQTDITAKKQTIAEQDVSRICTQHKIDYTIFRHAWIYGIGHSNPITAAARFIRWFGYFPTRHTEVPVFPPIHADDLAISAIKILNLEDTYNKAYILYGENEELTLRQLLKHLFELVSKHKRVSESPLMQGLYRLYIEFTGSPDLNHETPLFLHNPIYTTEKAKKDFGFAPRPLHHMTLKDI